jgi:hypothetical protein
MRFLIFPADLCNGDIIFAVVTDCHDNVRPKFILLKVFVMVTCCVFFAVGTEFSSYNDSFRPTCMVTCCVPVPIRYEIKNAFRTFFHSVECTFPSLFLYVHREQTS